MGAYSPDEQITVDVARGRDGYSPSSVRLFIPGHTETRSLSGELRRRTFATEADAANAAVEELRRADPDLLLHWPTREGFF